ncbi:MAG TPA: fibronectin type III domain-containing protein [Gemmatimonadaceae bacterium]|nr:fibronectin type III domain-containing protein [Gemmatimonadaceae bacterium]
MKSFLRRFSFLLTASLLAVAACSDDDDPAGPSLNPPLGLQVTAQGASVIRVSFTSTAGDDSYIIERAEGAAGTFAQVHTAAAPATAGLVTYDDGGLAPQTVYRYRVKAVRGSSESAYTAEQSVTTGAAGVSTKDVTGDITTSTTWYADTTYILKGFIHVANGATLTIQPGTTIKGDTLGASLFVLRGAKIMAQGTPAAPIVFTSTRPVGQRQPGDWGGLIIVGNATLNRTGVDIELEGTNTVSGSASGTNYQVLYSGGTTDSDNSGVLRYVRVEFAGYAPSLNAELNAFTFAAVGSGTQLSHLQVMAGLDDSFEWFGGTADATHLVSYESGDDHFDMSEGYRGRLQYLIALQSARLTPRTGAGSASSDPQGIENDGCEGAGCTQGRNSTPFNTPVVANFTLVGTNDVATSGSSGGVGMMLRRGTGGWYVNGLISRWPRAAISLRDGETYVRAGSTPTPDLATADLAIRGVLVAESPVVFQTGGSSTQNSLDLAGNGITQEAATTSSLLTAFPATITSSTTEAAFDWTPVSGSAAASGGLATFTGKLQTAAGSFVTGTAYRGAAEPGGAKWWQGWTSYAQR